MPLYPQWFQSVSVATSYIKGLYIKYHTHIYSMVLHTYKITSAQARGEEYLKCGAGRVASVGMYLNRLLEENS